MHNKNGVAERMIQTHNAKVQAVMLNSQHPQSLWAETINTANYLHVQTSHQRIRALPLREAVWQQGNHFTPTSFWV